MLSVFSIRSCMLGIFFLHFYSSVLWSFSDSQQWLGLPSLFGLQKVIVFGSVIMHLAFFFFFSLCFFFLFSFLFFFFMWSFHSGFVSTAHSGNRAAKFPHSIRTTTDPAMCAASLVQAACNCFETSLSLLPPALPPFLLSLRRQLGWEIRCVKCI